MLKNKIILSLIVTVGVSTCYADNILYSQKRLDQVKQELKSNGSDIKASLGKLRKNESKALNRGPLSVMNKTGMPPSKNKHDYMSVGKYWWPNPKKPDGLPYIRKDGKTNPAIMKGLTDQRDLVFMAGDMGQMALLYSITGEDKYAAKCASIIKTWFLDPETCMNPNLKYAQAVPGRSGGRIYGIIDFTGTAVRLVDVLALIKDSPHWTEKDDKQIKAWMKKYIAWLTSPQTSQAAWKLKNNIATWYYAQLIALHYYVGNDCQAKELIKRTAARLMRIQFKPDGSQPLELKRTSKVGYSVMNLKGWAVISSIAKHYNIDLWNYPSSANSTLKKGLAYLVQRPKNKKDAGRVVEILYLFQGITGDNNLQEMMKSVKKVDVDKHIKENILYLITSKPAEKQYCEIVQD